MTELDALLAGIVADPREETRWLVLADWLQEYDDPRRAELLRLHRCMLATCCEPDAHPQRAEWQARMVELLVAGVRPCVPQETLTLPGGVPLTFSFIPPGAFLMGNEKKRPDDDDADVQQRHRVEMPRGFFIGAYPVTQAQWFAVMGTAPSHFHGPARPVESVLLDDCQEFCAKLLELTQRSVGLPTEAEWEFACRAGTTTDYYFGDVLNTNIANYYGHCTWNYSPKGVRREQTTDVDLFPANPWSLFDLHGNVWEPCAVHIAPAPPSLPRSESLWAYRGGCYEATPYHCRSVSRRVPNEFELPGSSTGYRHLNSDFGFRVCLRL